jgi:phosphatidyl-myo-inositol dimannoside synthase
VRVTGTEANVRLLFISHSLPPEGRPLENVGGMQRVAIDLHDSLLGHGEASVRMCVLRSAWNRRHFTTPLFMASAAREITRLAARREIDAVLFSSLVTATLAVPLRAYLRRRGIVTAAIAYGLDATLPSRPYQTLVRRVFQSLDLVLPISHATAQACRERGLPAERCQVVLLGIRPDRFTPARDRVAARAKLLHLARRETVPRLILTSTGRLVPRKGVAWFTGNVMPLLPPDVVYFVAGEGEDRARIEAEIERQRLGDRVRLLGRVSESELEVLYQGADVFVMPNVPVAGDMEGFGLVILEAGLCGLPTVASRLEGIEDVITDGENGRLIESGDAAAFRDAIMAYYSDQAMLAEAARRARHFTAARFAWSGVTDNYVDAIRGVVARREAVHARAEMKTA